MACENLQCLINQLGKCFGARFLGEQPAALQNESYWSAKAEEENSRRRPANMAPVTVTFLRREHIADTRRTWRTTLATYCRPQDGALDEALKTFEAAAVSFS